MKKITFMLVLAFSAFGASAQNFYTVTTLQAPYADLENTTSINDGEAWFFDSFNEVNIPFEFKFRGEIVDRFLFDDDQFVLLTPGTDYFNSDDGFYGLFATSLFLKDRTYTTGVSSSPISYKVDGTQGNHILKLEIKNAGFEGYLDGGFDEDQFYTNFQVWLYEADNAIEIRYGASNLTVAAVEALNDGIGAYVAIGGPDLLTILTGDSTDPDDGEYTEETFPFNDPLSNYPADGTVYRFAPQEEAGLPGVVRNTIVLYPNPASLIINIKSGNTTISNYTVYDATGKCIQEKSIAAAKDISINVENFASGIYFIAVNDQHLKFVKN